MVSDTVILGLIGAVGTTVNILVTGYNQRKLNQLTESVVETGKNVDGRMDELLKNHGELQYKQGLADGKKDIYQ